MIDNDTFYFLYNIIYFVAAYFCFIFLMRSIMLPRANYSNIRKYALPEGLVVVFLLLLAILVGFREFNIGTDTGNYYRAWLYDYNLVEGRSDFAFYYIMAAVRSLFDSYQVFLLVVSLLFYSANYKAFKNYSRYFDANIFFVLFLFVSLFFSLSASINIVRQGLSLSFLFLGLSYIPNRNRSALILCCIASIGFHATAIIPILLLWFVHKFNKIELKYYVVLFFIGVLLSFFDFSILNFSSFIETVLTSANDKRITYLDSRDFGYEVGFRLDFVVFNTIFLILFLTVRQKLRDNTFYDYLLKYYCLSSFLFFMAFQISFSDRVGLFSWFAIVPLMVPVFNKSFDKKISLSVFLLVFCLYVYFFLIK